DVAGVGRRVGRGTAGTGARRDECAAHGGKEIREVDDADDPSPGRAHVEFSWPTRSQRATLMPANRSHSVSPPSPMSVGNSMYGTRCAANPGARNVVKLLAM